MTILLALGVPFPLRLTLLAILGALLGGLVNWAVYRLAWHPRPISPWSAGAAEAAPRRDSDRIPILGWLGLRREASIHGTAFWLRPMLVEVVMAAATPGLYWWEVGRQALVAPGVAPPTAAVLHAQYACHLVLMLLMLAGSLIDADEKIIPDTITLPGTLFGLVAVAVFPWVLLPDVARPMPLSGPGGPLGLIPCDFLRLSSPAAWPQRLGGAPLWGPLLVGLGCWWLWCVALAPRTWYSRHGWRRALQLSLARLLRDRSTRRIAALGLAGSVAVAAVWWGGGPHWQGLLTALVGMAAGGGIIWLVRIIGTAALGREAMGFGDVTLMAMIGTLLGWQACLIIFFLAPFAGLVVGLASLLLHRQPEIPYGPFLCLATAVVIVRWAAVWDWALPIFALGVFVPLVVLVGLAMMGGMLSLWRRIAG